MSALVTIDLDGRPVEAEVGRPLGALLHGELNGVLRRTAKDGAPRGVFCGMGVCFDCLVRVDGRAGVRACVTPIRAGMRVETVRS